jgi:hypothetical protein
MERPASGSFHAMSGAARALLLVCAAAVSAGAQDLSGVVRDSVTHRPIAGAVVTPRDSTGAALISQLSNERGEYRVASLGGARSLRIVRIGFEPRELTLPSGIEPGSRVDITLLALPSLLRPIRVVTNSRCPVRKDAAMSTGLWEQARAGLLATVVARERTPASIVRLLSQQVMDGNSDRVELMLVRKDSSVDTISFAASRTAREFVRSGFRHDSADRRMTYGPDALVLLSDDFAAAYCFHLADGGRARANQVGIHFSPAVQLSDRTDIDGTLWVDTVARELRDVDFTYVGVPRSFEAFRPGGLVSFRAMPNGVVLVDRWSIRSVGAAVDTVLETVWDANAGGAGGFIGGGRGGRGRGGSVRRDPVGGTVVQQSLRERLYSSVTSGELARATWPDGQIWTAPLGRLRAQVFTSDGQPGAGALVSLVGTPYFGNADSRGILEITGLLPGPYELRTIVDPRLAEMGIASGRTMPIVAVRDSTVSTTLAAPTAENFATERCAQVPRRPADSVFVLGQVVTADGRPVVDAKLTFATMDDGDVPRWHREKASTSREGVFLSCLGWKIGDVMRVRVNQTAGADVDVTRTVDSKLLLVRIALKP